MSKLTKDKIQGSRHVVEFSDMWIPEHKSSVPATQLRLVLLLFVTKMPDVCLPCNLAVSLRDRHEYLLVCRNMPNPKASLSVCMLPPAVCSSFLARDRRSCYLSSRIWCLL